MNSRIPANASENGGGETTGHNGELLIANDFVTYRTRFDLALEADLKQSAPDAADLLTSASQASRVLAQFRRPRGGHR
jgi:hypothetical protein